MPFTPLFPGLYRLALSIVSVYLLEEPDGLTLLDAGLPSSAPKILAALEGLGRSRADLRRIVITHLHGDHTGGLHALQEAAPAARTYAHAADAALIRQGISARPTQPGPGRLNGLLYRMMAGRGGMERTLPARVDEEIGAGDKVAGLEVIPTPGHTLGHIALRWEGQGGVLLVGDAASHLTRLGFSPLYEDVAEGRRSLARLGSAGCEAALFSHGGPLLKGASRALASLAAAGA